jgi:hypothetical protein
MGNLSGMASGENGTGGNTDSNSFKKLRWKQKQRNGAVARALWYWRNFI